MAPIGGALRVHLPSGLLALFRFVHPAGPRGKGTYPLFLNRFFGNQTCPEGVGVLRVVGNEDSAVAKRHLPPSLGVSHTLSVPLPLPDTIRLPSGLNAVDQTV